MWPAFFSSQMFPCKVQVCKMFHACHGKTTPSVPELPSHPTCVYCAYRISKCFIVLARSAGSAATFSRFIPELKARYDYGVMIFILTFAMVAVSSYRVDELLEFAHERVTTIAVGVAICLFTTLFIFPIWAGEDLHKLAAGSLDKLAEFLEGTTWET